MIVKNNIQSLLKTTSGHEVKEGSTAHKMASRVHNRVKAAHPNTSITLDHILDDLCNELIESGDTSLLGDAGDDDDSDDDLEA